MIKLILYFTVTSLLLCSLLETKLTAREPQPISKLKSSNSFYTNQREETACTVSNLSYWIKEVGQSIQPSAIYPRLTEWVIFADGLMWGGYVDDTINPQEVSLRVGGQTFGYGTTPGWIEQVGDGVNPAVRIDPAHPRARLYRILRGWENLTPDMADVIRDAAILNHRDLSVVSSEMAQDVIDQYEKDWNEWPVDLGAPLIDVNSNGSWDEAEGFANADQIIWFVINDLDTVLTRAFYGSPPIGLEVQITIWAYNQPDATLGQTVFKRFRMINKSGFQIDSMYVAQWVDPDLGVWSDDLVGCDIGRSLGFAYNGNISDAGFDLYNLPPPAIGYDFFQGPILYTGNLTDSAIFDFHYRSGYKNLPMTSFGYYSTFTGINDPEFGSYDGTLQWYNMLKGFQPTDDLQNPSPYIVGAGPDRGQPTKFPLSGDPFLQTGDIDAFGDNFAPGDRRFNLCSGPFNMAPGDTQKIVVALIGGIIPETGGNNRNAVAQMKLNDDYAQFLYDNLFQGIPKPPTPAPAVKFSELPDKIILNWGSEPDIYNETEKDDPILGFNFEGYNIYQLPSENATKSQATLVKTFDKINFITTIRADKFLPEFGDIVTVPIQWGTDSGIERYFIIEKDYIHNRPLYQGNKYYFAVTAYNYNADPNVPEPSLESALNIIEVIPQPPKPGTVYEGSVGSQLEVTQGGGGADGQSDGIVEVYVVDPARTTGHDYEVFFQVDEDTTSTSYGETLWNIRDNSDDIILFTAFQRQLTEVNESKTQPIFHGLQARVAGPAPGVKDWDIPQGNRRFTWANADFEFEGFNGAIGWGSPTAIFGGNPEPVAASELKNVLLILAQVTDADTNYNPMFDDPNDINISYAYRYGRNFSAPPQYPEFAPFIVNPSGGYSYQDFTKSVPLSAWDIDDPNNPSRLAVGFLENNQPGSKLGLEGGLVDGKWWPGDYQIFNNVAGSGPREWLWIFNADYSETANPDYQVDAIDNPIPVMYWLTVNRRGAVPFSPSGTGEDQFLILGSKINTSDDIFTFSAPAVTESDLQAKDDVEKIKVFPNPYYAYHSQESNRDERFITFTHLPDKATIRIFNLAGGQVRKLEKIPGDGSGQFFKWNLNNDSGLPVASGFYIALIDMPTLNKSKTVKFFILQRKIF